MARVFPFIDEPFPYYAIVAYLTIIYSVLWYTRSRVSLVIAQGTIKKLLATHNLILCLASVVMTAGYAYNVVRTMSEFGFYGVYCGVSDEIDSRLYFWTNVFYLSKFYELLDTLFLVVERKPPIFLHVWHHTSVIVLVCKSVQHSLLFAWWTGLNNCFVHIFMYYYYCMRSLNREVWWRQYITKAQIVQFLIDALTSVPFVYYRMTGNNCSGTWASWAGGNFVGLSFFILFVKFFNDNYKQKKPSKQA